ncbi:OsmC family protein [Roseinatronobacter sp. S2]|uniref:OsmC family protein n=1 Tax=Roseinatronobacter sp. S2 TaxID=3035471 RepID=UPI00240F3C28|nr:OsmC family protein [Roseinatronobacter sp. S2]WFE76442.1 OsmC family protein [Roseinatronobacter sp. S2]
MKRMGSAIWKGDLKTGTGITSTESGVLKDAQYGFATRFEDGPGTNPEELIGAAHASCFSMALSLILSEHGLVADQIATTATVTLDKVDGGFAVTKIHLDLVADIPGASDDTFMAAAEAAKAGCPISKLLNAEITLSAKLNS